MALSITGANPRIVTGTTSASQLLHDGVARLKFVYWYNITTAGDLCNLTNENGDSIIKMRASKDNDTQMWPIFQNIKGLSCDDMDSGTLYLYLR